MQAMNWRHNFPNSIVTGEFQFKKVYATRRKLQWHPTTLMGHSSVVSFTHGSSNVTQIQGMWIIFGEQGKETYRSFGVIGIFLMIQSLQLSWLTEICHLSIQGSMESFASQDKAKRWLNWWKIFVNHYLLSKSTQRLECNDKSLNISIILREYLLIGTLDHQGPRRQYMRLLLPLKWTGCFLLPLDLTWHEFRFRPDGG